MLRSARRYSLSSRLVATAMVASLVLPAPAQAWAQGQENQQRAERETQRFLGLLRGDDEALGNAALGETAATPMTRALTTASAVSDPSEVLSVPLLPKRVQILSSTNSQSDAWDLFDGRASTPMRLDSSDAKAIAVELPEARSLAAVTILGPTRGVLTVLGGDDAAGSPRTLVSEMRIEAEAGEWVRVPVEDEVKHSRLVLEWTPDAASGPAEIRLWGRWMPPRLAPDAELADQILATAVPGAHVAHATPERLSASRVSLGGGGPRDGVANVELSADPRSFARAFLVYELTGVGHFTQAVRRINGSAAHGGEPMSRAHTHVVEGGLQVEEISPEWLRLGTNQVEFLPVPAVGSPEYSVQHLRIVGTPHLSLAGAETVDARVVGTTSKQRFEFSDISKPHDLVFEVRAPNKGHLTVRADGSRAPLMIDLSGFAPGWHQVSLDGLHKTRAVEVSIDRAAGGGSAQREGFLPAVSEVMVTATPAAEESDPRGQIVVSYPLHGECRNGEAMLGGFVSAGELTVTELRANGQDVSAALAEDNGFSLHVPEPATFAGKPWVARLEAKLSNGDVLHSETKLAPCVHDAELDVPDTIEDEGAPYAEVLHPDRATTISFAGVKLEIPKGAVDRDVRLTIRPLVAGQVAESSPRVSNVSPEGRAYRFGPHGLKFKKPIKVTLPYDAGLLKHGQKERDILAFYYDEPLGSWQRIGRYGSADRGVLTSLTDHFTDFMNGVLAMPDEPGVKSFNANEMKDIKVADPGAGVALISPPAANSNGSMQLSYPIELPPGRNGVEPSLAITYNSAKSNGWLGVGWDLALPAIEIDTRFGVPRYDETAPEGRDQYLLSGESIVPTALGEDTYVRRVEGAFDTVQRNLTGTCVTSWTVRDKGGRVYTYGGSGATLSDPADGCRAFRWGLSSVQDTFGNRMDVTYALDAGMVSGADPFVELYPSRVDYTAHVNASNIVDLAPAYRVRFIRDGGNLRPDVIVTGRPGFQERTRYRLDHVDVELVNGGSTTLIRRYQLEYAPPDVAHFYKSLLSSIGQQGLGAAVQLDQHTFEYGAAETVTIDGTSGIVGFSAQEEWGNAQSGYALSGLEDEMGGGSGTLGIGLPIISVSVTAGGNGGAERTKRSLLDLNGDGLPDLATNGDSYMNFLRPELSVSTPVSQHLQPQGVAGLGLLGHSYKSGWSVGGGFSVVGIGPSASYSENSSHDDVVMIDINGDGLVDRAWIENGGLHWARNMGNNTFQDATSANNGLAQNSRNVNGEFVEGASQGGELARINPLVRWTAPVDGPVTITGPITKLFAGGNGVDLWVFKEGSVLWSHELGASDLTPCLPVGGMPQGNTGCAANSAGLQTTMTAGQSLYFMTSPHHDPNGPPNQLGLESIGNDVSWDPTVTYDGMPTSTLQEPYGLPVHEFSQEADFRQWWPEVQWVAPADGIVHVRNRTLFGTEAAKASVSDNATVRISRHPVTAPTTTSPTPFELAVPANSTSPIVFDEVFQVQAGDSIVVEVVSDTPIALDRLHLNPTISYVEEYCRNVSSSNVPYCGAVTCVAGPPVLCSIAGDPEPNNPVSAEILSRPGRVAYQFPSYLGEQTEALYPAGPQTLTVSGQLQLSSSQPTLVAVLVQGVQRLYSKTLLQLDGSGSVPINTPADVGAADQLMVTVYALSDVTVAVSGSVTAAGAPVPVTVKRRDTAQYAQNSDGTPVDPMSGGFHGWSTGFYNGDLPGGFTPSNIVFPVDGSGNPRHNPTRFFFGVPQSDAGSGESWSGPGGAIVAPGLFSATRGSVELGNSIGGLRSLRHASTWNFDLSLNIGPANLGVNQGRTKNDRDFFDFNGDRLPDAINADGTVQYGNGSGGFKWIESADGIDDLDALRRVDHGTLRAGISIDTQLINDTASDGSVRKTITTGFSAGTDYGLSATNIDWMDVNGDGLPDAVSRNPADTTGSHPFTVRFNYGYRLGPPTAWLASGWNSSTTGSATGIIGAIGGGDVADLIADLSTFGTSVGVNGIRLQDSGSNNLNVGGGGGSGGVTVSGGGGFSFGVSRTLVDMIDINGDGLPDQVIRVKDEQVDEGTAYLRVRLNRGDHFDANDTLIAVPKWDSSIDGDSDFTFSGNINDSLGFRRSKTFTTSFSVKVCFILCVGGSGFYSNGSSWSHSSLEDIDGDGRPDMVFKSVNDGEVYAKRNLLPDTLNLLQKVNRPLGGSIDVEYERSGNLVRRDLTPMIDAPSNQYVMSRVDVSDGEGNHYVRSFSYDHSAFHDRTEREDYGFAKVTTKRLLQSGATYSSDEVNYHNQDFYRKGLVSRTVTRGGDNKVYTVQNIGYDTAAGTCASVDRSRFPRETTRTSGYFEGSTTNANLVPAQSPCTATVTWESNPIAVFTCESKVFDCRGNLTNFTDRGDSGGLNQVSYEVNYDSPALLGANIYKPSRIRARDRAQQVIRERKATYDSRGALLTFTTEVIGGQDPVTGLTRTGHVLEPRSTWTYQYNEFGGVEVFTDPRGYAVNYEYDPATRTYRTQAQDSFGYTSTSIPDLRFGVVAAVTDLNLNIAQYGYDDFGRMVWVKGPYDSGTSNETISFSYSQTGVPVASGLPASNVYPAYALTSHRNEQHPTEPIVTATFADGLDRIIQTKKTVVRDIGSGPELGMSVTGEVVFDDVGRLAAQYQPYFDTGAADVLAPPPQDPILAVLRGHDVLDRETAVRTPIAPTPGGPEAYTYATTTTTYSVGKINTTARLLATVSDPNVIARGSTPSLPGYAREEYRGVRGNLLRVVEKNRLTTGGSVSTLPTSYGYNALGELTSVTDASGNITLATYDSAGRIVTLISPDAGRTDYLFDISGNLAAKQTAKLAYGFQRIYYEYDYNRLKKINYPNSPDVTFTYGAWTEAGPLSFYRASRIKQETSEAGTKEFSYELLGNVNEETWTLNSLGSGPNLERTFLYDYDSFGRLLAVHYPGTSEEVVSYGYDVGGNLDTVTGVTGTGITTPYVQHIGYDEFERKTSITLGNGITTQYSYDPYTRRMAGINASHRDPALVQAGEPARPFQQVTYTYDPVGNLVESANAAPVDPAQAGSVKVGPVTETYTYDDLYQLKTADGILQESETEQHRYGVSLSYSLNSNVTKKTQLSETDALSNGAIVSTATRNDQTYTSTYTYPAGSRPHAVAQISDVVPGSGTVARTFAYDRNGNQETWQRTSGGSLSRTTTYNDDNRVVSVSQNGATLQQALYDGAGQRLVKRANQSAQTAYFGQYLTVRDSMPTTKHIFAGGVRVASKFVPNDANEECVGCPDRPNVTYFHSDHLGSTSFATDEEQTLLSHQQYFPSGELWLDQTNSITAAQQPYLFSGKELDLETGLYYFGARYYDPRAGLWTTPDPILKGYMLGAPNAGFYNPKNLNSYGYAWNNPLTFRDPTGAAVDDNVFVRTGKSFLGIGFGMAKSLVPGGFLLPQPTGELTNDSDFLIGQSLGEGTVAAAEMAAGATMMGGGGAAEFVTIGVATPVAVPAIALGAAVATHGLGTGLKSADTFAMAMKARENEAGRGTSDVVTANGQKAAADGTRLGPSGKPEYHYSDSSTRKQAIDGAKAQGSGQVVKDNAGKVQPEHWHAVKQNGERVSGPEKTHFNVRGAKPKGTQ